MSHRPQTALITGSTSGIGLAIARKMFKQGFNVVIHGLVSQTEGQKIADEITHSALESQNIRTHNHKNTHEYKPPYVIFIPGDVSHTEETQTMCRHVQDKTGGIDILVNNAGAQYTADIQDIPSEKWESILAVNLSSAFYTMSAFVPSMRERGFGRIINIASVHGLVASLQKSPYVASKFGLVGLSKVVALENATKGITVNCICPGWVLTELIEPQIADRTAQCHNNREAGIQMLVAEKQPSQRMSTPEDIAEIVLFLCSAAAHNITGITLPVDGGWTAQ